MKTVYYIANVYDEELNIEDSTEFTTNNDIHAVNGGYDELEVEWLVKDIAEHYYSAHDGWEVAQTWESDGLTFALWDDKKNFVGKFEVSLEFSPSFSASKIRS